MNQIKVGSSLLRKTVKGLFFVGGVALLATMQPAAQAQNEKVTICHIPPGNPENAHTITISINALQTHLDQHGDFVGDCEGGGEEK
jgi:hypothetical protein